MEKIRFGEQQSQACRGCSVSQRWARCLLFSFIFLLQWNPREFNAEAEAEATRTHTHTRARTHTRMHARTHTHTHKHTRTHIHTHTHTHTSLLQTILKLAGRPSPAEGKSERGELGDQGDLRQVTSEDCSIVILSP